MGEVTSGSFSPSLNVAIALARVDAEVGGSCHVDIRGKRKIARIVSPTFFRKGKARVDIPEA